MKTTEIINAAHPDVTTYRNKPEAKTKIATLTVTGSRVWRFIENEPLILKLYRVGGGEISPAAKVWFSWRRPGGVGENQIGNVFSYNTFRRIPIGDQASRETQNNRLVGFDDEERERARAINPISIITGLPDNYKIDLMIESPAGEVVDWDNPLTQFEIKAEVLTDAEWRREQEIALGDVAPDEVGF